MIFVTTGSQKFQFDRLLKKIDELIEKGVIREEVYAQIGYSDYRPENYSYTQFMDREAFAGKMSQCQIVITHGGTGVIIGAVKQGKKVIAVPRLARYGEHVDDHQVQLLKEFDGMNIICACYDLDKLEEFVRELPGMEFQPYVSNTDRIIRDIEAYLQDSVGKRK